MLYQIIKSSFLNQKKSMALMIASVAVGTAMAASLITISFEITGKISNELRAFGANILVEPKVEGLADISGQKRYLHERDIIKVKTIFWRHNIIGVSPVLEASTVLSHQGKKREVEVIGAWYEKELQAPGEKSTFSAGIRSVSPWWKIDGEWPAHRNEIVIGSALASALEVFTGDSVTLNRSVFRVSGIIETGGEEDSQVFMELQSLQEFSNKKGKISRVLVSAITKPMDEFAYKDPDTMTQTEYEKWYCTGYVTSISKQVEEVFTGSKAKPIWHIAESEGRVLNKLRLLIYLLCVTALVASALGVSTTMIISLLRRTEEIGLMKAMGADRIKIISIFVTEGIVIGCIGGFLGYLISVTASQYIGIQVFGTALQQMDMLLPVAVGSAVFIALAGTILPVRKALHIMPVDMLKGAE